MPAALQPPAQFENSKRRLALPLFSAILLAAAEVVAGDQKVTLISRGEVSSIAQKTADSVASAVDWTVFSKAEKDGKLLAYRLAGLDDKRNWVWVEVGANGESWGVMTKLSYRDVPDAARSALKNYLPEFVPKVIPSDEEKQLRLLGLGKASGFGANTKVQTCYSLTGTLSDTKEVAVVVSRDGKLVASGDADDSGGQVLIACARSGRDLTRLCAALILVPPNHTKVFIDEKECRVDEHGIVSALTDCSKLKLGESGRSMVRVEYSNGEKKFTENKRLRVIPNTTTRIDYRDVAEPDKKRRTYDYWCEVDRILHEAAKGAKPDEYTATWKSMAKAVDELPCRGVDEEAIDCVQDLGNVLLKKAEFYEKDPRAARAPEAFIRGVLGDPLKVADEISAEEKAIDKQVEETLSKAKKLRAILSSRYDNEFPNLLK
jgi:hypothetical protein